VQNIKTILATEAIFSDDGKKRYLLRKTWDDSKPILSIIMLAPSEAAGIELDSTTLLVLNDASRLGYGSVDVLNLFATLNDFGLKEADFPRRSYLEPFAAENFRTGRRAERRS